MPRIATKEGDAKIQIKRIYEAAAPADGTRILVDRIWPRGVSKARAAIVDWIKEVAPSTELRKAFGHDPERWPDFRVRYRKELAAKAAEIDRLLGHLEQAQGGVLTLVYSARDEERNQAVVLAEYLRERVPRRRS